AGSKEVKVTFPSLNAYPIVHVRPYGTVGSGYWVTQVTDSGFTIIVSEAPSFDLTFSWTAEASSDGSTMSFSDNTSAPYDPTSGLIYGPMLPETVIEEVATSTVSEDTASSTTSTE
ncbi:MAG: hypothetical protein RDU25_06105, partial [Patescibacteria group bacterium]|nr:hypothetical protein [Patescibacteria group bacterium]